MNFPYQVPSHLRFEQFEEGKDVFDFHEKFLVPMAGQPSFLDNDSMDFRIKFMREELNEFIEAVDERDLLKAADALIDLVYVAVGTALMMGLPWRSLWNRVQAANMGKERAADDGSNSKRGSPLDVIKPAGWVPPDHSLVLGNAPWPVFDASNVGVQIASYLKARAKQGTVESTGVVTNPDGTRHYVSVADPATMRTETGS